MIRKTSMAIIAVAAMLAPTAARADLTCPPDQPGSYSCRTSGTTHVTWNSNTCVETKAEVWGGVGSAQGRAEFEATAWSGGNPGSCLTAVPRNFATATLTLTYHYRSATTAPLVCRRHSTFGSAPQTYLQVFAPALTVGTVCDNSTTVVGIDGQVATRASVTGWTTDTVSQFFQSTPPLTAFVDIQP